MYSLVCVFISQYSNKVRFILMGEAKMGGQTSPKLGGQWRQAWAWRAKPPQNVA